MLKREMKEGQKEMPDRLQFFGKLLFVCLLVSIICCKVHWVEDQVDLSNLMSQVVIIIKTTIFWQFNALQVI